MNGELEQEKQVCNYNAVHKVKTLKKNELEKSKDHA